MQKNPSILFIGHFAIDTIIKDNEDRSRNSLGGSVSYCSLSLRKYTKNVNIYIVSKIGKRNFHNSLLSPIEQQDIDIQGVNLVDSNNTKFTLNYHNHSRSLTLTSKSPNLTYHEIPDSYLKKDIDAIIFVPICNEISLHFVKEILKNYPNSYIGMDLQGFIRKIEKDGKVLLAHNSGVQKTLEEIIKLIGERLILKGSEDEMKILSKQSDLIEVMKYFQKFRGIFIMTLGENGSLITSESKNILKIPAFKANQVVDETGAGDVYLAIFIYEFLKSKKDWNSIEKAALYASVAASFEIEKEGVDGFQPKERIKKRLKLKKYTH
jgi:sugar/nucleoside kinase (ribokinase family)